MTKLKALKNISHNGMKLIGDEFEETSKKNIAYLTTKGLAKVVEESTEVQEDTETETPQVVEDSTETEDEFLDEDVDFEDGPIDFDEEELEKADTHAKLDTIQEKYNLEHLPGKDKLNLAQRKAKIRSELVPDAE